MTDRTRSRLRWVVGVIALTLAKSVGYFLSVMKPPEQTNAQTMLSPEPFPARADEYRP
ncbi:hypothetical protein ACFT30_06910 [Microbacterium ureisolvens]|uniref:hypothetical protein n=1 Tax=Microbacterium ureisolvens TaxID=2781186 RepID=UPI00363B12A0